MYLVGVKSIMRLAACPLLVAQLAVLTAPAVGSALTNGSDPGCELMGGHDASSRATAPEDCDLCTVPDCMITCAALSVGVPESAALVLVPPLVGAANVALAESEADNLGPPLPPPPQA